MWPNHTRMLQFYVTDFVPLLPGDGRMLEIGPGHGLLAAVLLAARRTARYTGVDISPRSISYSAGAFAAAGIAADRYELVVADACAPGAALGSDDTFGAAVCCEVLEHVDDPVVLLRSLRSHIAPGTPAFVSTVANMEAEDHVFLFDDAAVLRSRHGCSRLSATLRSRSMSVARGVQHQSGWSTTTTFSRCGERAPPRSKTQLCCATPCLAPWRLWTTGFATRLNSWTDGAVRPRRSHGSPASPRRQCVPAFSGADGPCGLKWGLPPDLTLSAAGRDPHDGIMIRMTSPNAMQLAAEGRERSPPTRGPTYVRGSADRQPVACGIRFHAGTGRPDAEG